MADRMGVDSCDAHLRFLFAGRGWWSEASEYFAGRMGSPHILSLAGTQIMLFSKKRDNSSSCFPSRGGHVSPPVGQSGPPTLGLIRPASKTENKEIRVRRSHEAGGDSGALQGGPGIPLVSSSVAARSPISKPGLPDDLPESWEPLDIS